MPEYEHQLDLPPEVEATIRYEAEDPNPVEVTDMSRWGARFVASDAGRLGETIMFAFQREGQIHRIRAIVKWTSQEAFDRWAVGCEFRDAPGDGFESCFTAPIVRHEAGGIPATIRLGARNSEAIDASILNYSRTGVCLQASHDFKQHDSILLELPDPDGEAKFLLAHVKWSRIEADATLVGCAFPEDRDAWTFFELVQQRIEEARAEPLMQQERAANRSRRAVVVGFAVALAWSVGYCIGPIL